MTNTKNEVTLNLSQAMCQALYEALQPVVKGEQSRAQLTLVDEHGTEIELILQGDAHDIR